MTSVVVPAHNEERSIGACLSALLADADDGEFEVIVVCNGCSDRTAEIARSFGRAVTVAETPVASKARALVLGDRTATRFPRVYVDGDVVLHTWSVRALIEALREQGILAVSPRPSYELGGASLPVRSYHRIWEGLPGVRAGLVGAGVYAVSEEGRRRFGDFPDVLGDDHFVQQQFVPDERRVVHEAVSVVESSRTARDLIGRKVRVFVGNREFGDRFGDGGATTRWTGFVDVVRKRPSSVVHLPAFVTITVLAKLLAGWRYRRGTWRSWSGHRADETSSGQLSLAGPGPDREPRPASPPVPQMPVLDGTHNTRRERTP